MTKNIYTLFITQNPTSLYKPSYPIEIIIGIAYYYLYELSFHSRIRVYVIRGTLYVIRGTLSRMF